MVNFLLKQQSGYKKFLCFLCLWYSRARDKHWVQKDCLSQRSLLVDVKNVINIPPVQQEKIVFSPLHATCEGT